MVKTLSTMLPLGTPAPAFSLPDTVTGGRVCLSDFEGDKPLLVLFLSRHCPYVIRVKEQLAALGDEYGERVSIVAIASNDTEAYPDDAPDKLAAMAREEGFTFPVLFDASQQTAKDYRAACTPDIFLFDGAKRLFYRGQLDAARPGNEAPNDGADLRRALDAVLAGQDPPEEQIPSMGCNIKWKPGNEPSYFG